MYSHLALGISVFSEKIIEYPIIDGKITIPSSHWVKIKGVEESQVSEDVVITSKNGKIDLSPFFHRLETLLNQSDYGNHSFMNRNAEMLRKSENIKKLCETLSVTEQMLCLEDLEISTRELKNKWLNKQTQRILYPGGYIRIGHYISESDEAYVRSLLEEKNCLSLCNDSIVAEMFLFGTESQFRQVANHLRDQGKSSCLRSPTFRENISYALDNNSIPTACQELKNHRVCQNIYKDSEEIKNRIQYLFNTSQSNYQVQFIERCIGQVELIKIAQNFWSDLDDHLVCNPYQLGEERVKQIEDSIARTTKGYKIKKENDGSYTATLILEFQATEDYEHENHLSPSQVNTYYRGVVQNCLNDASSKILGPNGERLNIVIVDAKNVHPCTPKQTIKIGPPDDIGKTLSFHYPSNVDQGYCPILVHETLHILGLNDGYISIAKAPDDTGQGNILIDETDCSLAKFQINSIMSDPYQRFYNVFEAEKDDSLLDPAHFNQIIYAGCRVSDHQNSTHLFRSCSEFGLFSSMHCSEKRNRCEAENTLGRSKERELQLIDDEISSNYRFLRERKRSLSRMPETEIESLLQDYERFLRQRRESVSRWP